LLRNAWIKDRIQELSAPIIKKQEITIEYVLKELVDIATAKASDFYEEKNGSLNLKKGFLDSPKANAIHTIDPSPYGPKLKMKDANKALATIAQHLGMLVNKIELKAEINTKIDYKNLTDNELEVLQGISKKISD
jgi:hypothetical protein